MVYKYVRVCPYYKQGIACATDLICWMKLVGNPSIQKKITITWISSIRIANKWLQNNTVCISPKQVMYLRIFLSKTGSRIQTLSSSPIQQILVKYPPPPSIKFLPQNLSILIIIIYCQFVLLDISYWVTLVSLSYCLEKRSFRALCQTDKLSSFWQNRY